MGLTTATILFSSVGIIIGLGARSFDRARVFTVNRKPAADLYERVAAAITGGERRTAMHPALGMPYGDTGCPVATTLRARFGGDDDAAGAEKMRDAYRERFPLHPDFMPSRSDVSEFWAKNDLGPDRRPDEDLPDGWITYDFVGEPTIMEVTSIETCDMCKIDNGQHDFGCPQRIIDDIFNRRIGDGWKQAMMPELFVSRILTAQEIAELEEYPLAGALAAPPNIGGLGKPKYQGPHYDSTHGAETRFVPYEMLGEPMRGTAVHAIGPVACVGPIELSGEPSCAEPHHFTTVRD